MCGKNCVAIASDTRFGAQHTTVATNTKRVFKMTDKTYLGLSGLLTDVQTLKQKFDFHLKMYTLREERQIEPKTFATLVSTTLYAKRFGPYFVEPVVAGLSSKDDKPFICAMDLIGAPVFTEDFVVAGSSGEELYGMCEALWREDMDEEELFETISQCLLAAVDRDCLAGWGADVVVITPEGVTKRKLKCRQD